MATFIKNTPNEGDNNKDVIDRDEIEFGILKQLFYKVSYKKYHKVDIENFIKLVGNRYGCI